MQKPEIIAGEIQNLTDARYFAAREVSYLSFRFDDHFGAQQAAAIREWVDGVQMMGAFDFQSATEIHEIATFAGLHAIETGMFFDPEEASRLAQDFQLFRRMIVEHNSDADELRDNIHATTHLYRGFILDFRKNNLNFAHLEAGNSLNLDFLAALAAEAPIFLSIDIQPGEINTLLQRIEPRGLELIGGAEEKTGFKSFDELDLLLDHLEELFD